VVTIREYLSTLWAMASKGKQVAEQEGETRRPGRTWRDLLLKQMLPMLLPVITLGASAMASANHGLAKLYWYTIAGSAVLGAAAVSVSKEREKRAVEEQAVGAKTALAMALSGAGQPLIYAMNSVAAASELEEARAAMKVLINRTVAIAQEECGRQIRTECRTRAAFYRFEASGDLVLDYHEGRPGENPQERFNANGSQHDLAAIKTAQSKSGLVINDLVNKPPTHFKNPAGRTYKSFIALPVRTDTKSYGMLVADSTLPHSLSDVDKGYLVLLAGILAAGLAHLEKVERLQQEISGSTNQIVALRSDYERLRNERNHMQAEHGRVKNERDQLRTQHSDVKNERDQFEDECERLRNERDALKNDRDGLKAELDKLEAELVSHHGQASQAGDDNSEQGTFPAQRHGEPGADNVNGPMK
jgi:GAF domain-containing protein